MKQLISLLSIFILIVFSACHPNMEGADALSLELPPVDQALAPPPPPPPPAPADEPFRIADYEIDPVPQERYNAIVENPFIPISQQAISTFSIDADGASYANVRRFIQQDQRVPPAGALRTEEMINYFDLDYPYENTTHPISLNGEVSPCPWNEDNQLVRIGIKGRPMADNDVPPANFVFLIDVSGSMVREDKLEMLKSGFKLFVDELSSDDRVAIVTYAGSAGVVLPSTTGDRKTTIKNAINRLGSGGSTAGAQGILTAYEIARAHFIEGGNNRIIIGTDGDFNVGPSSQSALVEIIEAERDFGIFLTVLGVGRGNLNDGMLEQIANNGNGTYEYIDHIEQLRKVFIYDYQKFYTVAKDVKVQVEFDPNRVQAYRLIGYENRLLNTEDFEDDKRDAGEIGAGQNITALYEIVPADKSTSSQTPTFTIDFRYKEPDSDTSTPLELPVFDLGHRFDQASDFTKFTAGVALFSMLLNDSEYSADGTYDDVLSWLEEAELSDKHGFKAEFRDIVVAAKSFYQ
ncbi:MAG: VWA domain-containing protein [Bacteroidota bacterium]